MKPAVSLSGVKLCNQTVNELPADVRVPLYDRRALTPGIVHIGLGNFHRAHQSWYIHRLMQKGLAHDWAIIGASVRSHDIETRKKLIEQDCLTSLIQLDSSGVSAEITGSMIDYLPIEADNRALIEQMSAPSIRMVSLTVTEGGYYIDPVSGEFDTTQEDIRHDASNPESPKTAFGAIIAALHHRREAGHSPITLLSCDNLPSNGNILRQSVVAMAGLSDPELASWIDENCSFPNSVVDCIVPATGAKEIEIAESFGIIDAVPVTHESFRQWIIEDKFCAGRPPLEDAGVIFSDDVHDYEILKIRLLNAGHQMIANIGEVLSFETISESISDPLLRAFFRKVAIEGVIPGIKPVSLMPSQEYLDLVCERFSNPVIKDSIRRVAFDGSSRHMNFILPIIRDGLRANTPINGLSLAEALWARMCAGIREDGSVIEPNDPIWEELKQAALQARNDPTVWLRQKGLYGDLADNQEFSEVFAKWLSLIWSEGCRSAVQTYLNEAPMAQG